MWWICHYALTWSFPMHLFSIQAITALVVKIWVTFSFSVSHGNVAAATWLVAGPVWQAPGKQRRPWESAFDLALLEFKSPKTTVRHFRKVKDDTDWLQCQLHLVRVFIVTMTSYSRMFTVCRSVLQDSSLAFDRRQFRRFWSIAFSLVVSIPSARY